MKLKSLVVAAIAQVFPTVSNAFASPDLSDQLQQALDDLAYRHHGGGQRQRGNQAREHHCNEIAELDRNDPHLPDDLEAVAEIGQ